VVPSAGGEHRHEAVGVAIGQGRMSRVSTTLKIEAVAPIPRPA
jgi:hypothetical protein